MTLTSPKLWEKRARYSIDNASNWITVGPGEEREFDAHGNYTIDMRSRTDFPFKIYLCALDTDGWKYLPGKESKSASFKEYLNALDTATIENHVFALHTNWMNDVRYAFVEDSAFTSAAQEDYTLPDEESFFTVGTDIFRKEQEEENDDCFDENGNYTIELENSRKCSFHIVFQSISPTGKWDSIANWKKDERMARLYRFADVTETADYNGHTFSLHSEELGTIEYMVENGKGVITRYWTTFDKKSAGADNRCAIALTEEETFPLTVKFRFLTEQGWSNNTEWKIPFKDWDKSEQKIKVIGKENWGRSTPCGMAIPGFRMNIREYGGMNMRNKGFALSLCLVAASLCACGGGNADSASEQRDAQQAQEAALQAESVPGHEEEKPMEKQSWRVEELTLKIGEDDIYGVMYLPDVEKETYPTVILSHGFGGTADICKPYAEIFAANGYACYALDFRGGGNQSRSSGSTAEMSVLTEAADLSAVLEQIRALDYVDENQVFLWGESQGGFVSAYVAANHPEDVKALILYYPAFVLQDDARAKYPNPADIPEIEDVWGTTLGAVYNIDAMSFDIYEVIGDYKGDVLIVHGDKDPVVPLSYSERATEVYESSKLIVFKDGEHGFWNRVEEAAAHSLEFLQAHTL